MRQKREHIDLSSSLNDSVCEIFFICVLCAICGKNLILFLTTDSADFTDKIAGRASLEARASGPAWRCPAQWAETGGRRGERSMDLRGELLVRNDWVTDSVRCPTLQKAR
jgi:hypothetical protein